MCLFWLISYRYVWYDVDFFFNRYGLLICIFIRLVYLIFEFGIFYFLKIFWDFNGICKILIRCFIKVVEFIEWEWYCYYFYVEGLTRGIILFDESYLKEYAVIVWGRIIFSV